MAEFLKRAKAGRTGNKNTHTKVMIKDDLFISVK